jgi:hypothetical protein
VGSVGHFSPVLWAQSCQFGQSWGLCRALLGAQPGQFGQFWGLSRASSASFLGWVREAPGGGPGEAGEEDPLERTVWGGSGRPLGGENHVRTSNCLVFFWGALSPSTQGHARHCPCGGHSNSEFVGRFSAWPQSPSRTTGGARPAVPVHQTNPPPTGKWQAEVGGNHFDHPSVAQVKGLNSEFKTKCTDMGDPPQQC